MSVEMRGLLTRVEQQIGPNVHLDEEIAAALASESYFARLADAPKGVGCTMYRYGDRPFHSAYRVTSSIDAAVALTTEVLHGSELVLYVGHKGQPCALLYAGDDSYKAHAPTLPLAILSALLRALLAQAEQEVAGDA